MRPLTLGSIALLCATPLIVGAQTVAITGGRVYTMTGAPIDNGTVILRDGRVAEVGANVAVPAGAQRIDATGKIVTPGFINSATELGLVDIGLERDTRDQSARGKDNIAAAFTVWEGFNPASVYLAPARNEGITTVVIAPSGGIIAGQAAVVDLVKGSISDMLVRAPVAMIADVADHQNNGPSARGELLVRLRELLEDTRAYSRRKADYERAATRDFAASRLDLEAMIPVVEGREPLVVAADRASDIEAALRIAREYNLKLIIAGGAEGWLVADKLAAAHVPVFTGAMSNIPSSFSTLGSYQENAAQLKRAGVDVVLIGDAGTGDAETFNVRNLKQEAGNAVAYGMSWDDALRAVTIVPARVLGIGDRYGSLEAGKVANVVVWSGDPFEFSSRAEHVFVRGTEIGTPSRQDMLEQRYRTLPPDYRKPQ
ncbi:MAG TPA: amidohydrolase family protein [Gemmatimonadaceae bacterium]|nr:amidohydrolase family protein [Gemmatimonadaceae bacterium]